MLLNILFLQHRVALLDKLDIVSKLLLVKLKCLFLSLGSGQPGTRPQQASHNQQKGRHQPGLHHYSSWVAELISVSHINTLELISPVKHHHFLLISSPCSPYYCLGLDYTKLRAIACLIISISMSSSAWPPPSKLKLKDGSILFYCLCFFFCYYINCWSSLTNYCTHSP